MRNPYSHFRAIRKILNPYILNIGKLIQIYSKSLRQKWSLIPFQIFMSMMAKRFQTIETCVPLLSFLSAEMENQIGLSNCLRFVSYQLKVERKLLRDWFLLDDDIRISQYKQCQDRGVKLFVIYNMIELYAIINDDHIMQTYVRNSRSKRQMQALIKHALKIIKRGDSKIIKSIKISDYNIYYFRQASFIFLLATQIDNRVNRMQNYLRVVADIFYESYDEKKFHYVLDRIMDQINKTQFGGKKQTIQIEDEESSLVNVNVLQEKMKLSTIIDKKHKDSIRAYVIMTILFLGIVILAGIYLLRRWN